ncbi:hypothetical protein B0T18DRAFT_440247 [Schizothecium vesticola]|uniref:Zinc finger PHD-type domain-containing protein n=1 Tax=Schizothecium vesticola TaxID=314040 RepID=A0AA40EJX5_9PEZI|nr:hypothetical protein B0T18DRAFT_440247 [Schizothecium vesticola]
MKVSRRPRRNLPFLHRNWMTSTNYWFKMGNSPSTLSTKGADKPFGAAATSQRAAKRRRIANDYDGFPLYEDHKNTTRALRIEILKIFHKDAPRLKNGILNGIVPPNVRDITHVKARCKLSIRGLQGGQLILLHVDSQVCDLKIFKNPAGSMPMARVASIKPFHIPEDKIYLQRDDDAIFGLADSYQVRIELESAGDANWPPRMLVPISIAEEENLHGCLPARQWGLSATINDIYSSRNRKSIRLRVDKKPNQDALTNFVMDVDVRWLTPISSQLAKMDYEKDVLECITAIDPDDPQPLTETVVNGINGVGIHHEPPLHGDIKLVNGQVPGVATEPTEELGEEELTPGRARRTRPEINYNVKQLWSKAVGKEPRKRRRASDETEQVDEHIITYILPPEQVQAEQFGCLMCGAEHERFSQLRAHYACHPQWEFRFEMRPKGIFVTISAVAGGPAPIRPSIYQLGLPVTSLDLDRYVNGDFSWVTSRLGPDDGLDISTPKFPPVKTHQQKPTTAARRPGPPKQRKILVPNIKQALYDSRSKVQLIPGTELRQRGGDAIDDAWLLRKHKDNLADFTDVEPAEKEYMQEWDAYVLHKHLSSPQYLPRAFTGFVRDRAGWIVANKSRADEFSKHVAMLLARRVIPDAAVVEATHRILEARAALREAPPPPVEEEGAKVKPKSKAGCGVCGQPVPVSGMLICVNKRCKTRMFHAGCVEKGEEALETGSKWMCKTCAADPS